MAKRSAGRNAEAAPSNGPLPRISKRYKTLKGTRGSARSFADWYTRPDAEIWEAVQGHVRNIRQRQSRRRYEQAIFQNLYCNTGSAWQTGLFRPGDASGAYARLSVNVVKSCVDTACARIAKDKPRVFILPNSGDQSLIKRADDSTKFLDGAFISGKVHEANEDMFRDGGIFGDGYVWFREGDGEVVADNVKVDEMVIDEVNGIRNKPTEMHICRIRPRSEVVAEYSDNERAIEDAAGQWRGDLAFMAQHDLVMVTYSWRLPSGPKAKDGRYAVTIDRCTLHCEEWDRDYIPIVRWQWTPPTYGPFGMGITHELEGMQAAISRIVANILESIHLFAVPRVWIDKMAKMSVHTLDNGIGVNQYSGGTPPVFSTPPAASPDIYQFLQWLIDLCYKQLGLSQLTAQSEKPAGLNSGVGLRNYQDIETQRFAIVGQRWERLYLEEAEIILDMAARMYAAGTSMSVNVPGRGFVEKVDWKRISMKRDQYEMQAFPASILPRTPEGQLQSVQELLSSGLMPRDVALGQLRIPNVDNWIKDETASRDNTAMCLSRILDKGLYRSPNGIANIDLAVTMAMSAYLRADLDDSVERDRVDLLLRWLDEALAMQAQKNTPPAPTPGAGAPSGAAVGQAPAPPPAPLAPAGAGAIPAAA